MKIEHRYVETKNGNTLILFYNPDNDLVVLDLVDKEENGGHELLRRTINEKNLLKHASK
jgi:hypothetical protein